MLERMCPKPNWFLADTTCLLQRWVTRCASLGCQGDPMNMVFKAPVPLRPWPIKHKQPVKVTQDAANGKTLRLQVPWHFTGLHWSFWKMLFHQRILFTKFQWLKKKILSNPAVITVSADGLAPLGARPSAGSVMINFRCRRYMGPALEGLKWP